MNKKKLLDMLAKKEARKKELGVSAAAATDIAVLRGINSELETLNDEIAELRSITDAMPDDAEPIAGGSTQPTPGAAQQRGQELPGSNPVQQQVLGTYFPGQQMRQHAQETDPYNTLEYRNAFMTYAKTGKITPELRMNPEQRANEMTTVAEAYAVIPTTILNEIIKKVTVYGQVYNRVRKTNIKGGVSVPILSLKPTASWITEAAPSDKKKVTTNTKVSFIYYGLECKVSVSLLAATVTLDGFESTIIDLIVEAMIKAIDLAVIGGSGSDQPTGITVDTRVPSGQKITISSDDFSSWEGWSKQVFAKMPLAYKAGATILMASGTFEGYINGMVDAQGQPIGRINYGITDGPQERFGGKEVILVEDDVVKPYGDAAVGDIVAIYCNLKDYAFNSNMQMTMFHYFDHDTNEWVDKAILIADGKLLDTNGVIIVKKGA